MEKINKQVRYAVMHSREKKCSAAVSLAELGMVTVMHKEIVLADSLYFLKLTKNYSATFKPYV